MTTTYALVLTAAPGANALDGTAIALLQPMLADLKVGEERWLGPGEARGGIVL